MSALWHQSHQGNKREPSLSCEAKAMEGAKNLEEQHRRTLRRWRQRDVVVVLKAFANATLGASQVDSIQDPGTVGRGRFRVVSSQMPHIRVPPTHIFLMEV